MRHLFARGSIFTAASAIQLVANVVLLPLTTRVVPPDQFGIVAAMNVVAALLLPIAGAGLSSALTREHFSSSRARAAGVLVTVTVGSSLLVVVLTDALAPVWIDLFTDVSYSAAARATIYAVVPSAITTTVLAQLRAEDRARSYVALALASSIIARLLGIALAARSHTADAFLAGSAVGSVISGVAALWLVRALRPNRQDGELIRRSFRVGLPVVPHLVAMWLLIASDRIVVERYRGAVDAGRYQIAYALGTLPILVLGALNNAWGPIIHGSRSDATRWLVLARTRDVVTRLTVLLIAGTAIGAPLILRVVAPPSYDTSALTGVVATVALSGVPYVDYLVHMRVLFHERQTHPVVWITPMVATANVVANILTVPHFGLIAAGVNTVAAYALLAVLVARPSQRLVELRLPELRLWQVCSASALALLISLTLPTHGAGLVGRGVVCATLGVMVVLQVRALVRRPIVAAN